MTPDQQQSHYYSHLAAARRGIQSAMSALRHAGVDDGEVRNIEEQCNRRIVLALEPFVPELPETECHQ